jgi:hypothetical protein
MAPASKSGRSWTTLVAGCCRESGGHDGRPRCVSELYLVSGGCCSWLVAVITGSQQSSSVGSCKCVSGDLAGVLAVAVLPSLCPPVCIQLGLS